MVSPLVKYRRIEMRRSRAYDILAYNAYVKARDKLIYTVVDFGVDMVRTSRKHDNLPAVLFSLVNNLVATDTKS